MGVTPFGERLRAWRKRRGFSQLDLAIEADTTPRHVSFIETGRSQPGRELIRRLAEALELSLRDHNGLLVAAGLPPRYSEHAIDDAAMAPVRSIIDRVLDNHNPYPAFAFAPGLRLLGANRTAERLFPGLSGLSARELIESWCSPQPDVPQAVSRAEAYKVVAMLRRERVRHPHPELPALLEHAEGLARRLGPPPEEPDTEDEVVMCGSLRLPNREIETIATVMRFDKPLDLTVAGLRVELIFPADAAADAFFRSLE